MNENIYTSIKNMDESWDGHSFNEVEEFVKDQLLNKYDKVCDGQDIEGRVVVIGDGNTLATTQLKISDLRTNSQQSDWNEVDSTEPAYILNKPKLNTDNTNSLPVIPQEAITGTVNLHKVSKTGSYNDLNEKPTIPPAANNGTMTINRNNVQIGTFSANQSANTTVNITVPTKTNDLDNDSGFITINDVPSQVNADWEATSGPAQIKNKPAIPAPQVNSDWDSSSGVSRILNKPTKLSDFNDDIGYATREYVDEQDSGKQDTLVSGVNIKTINSIPIVGGGNINIPKGEDAVNPFKGWYSDSSELPRPSVEGDFAYVSYTTDDDPPQEGAHIWMWSASQNQWYNTNREVDTSDVHTFETGENVNEVSIVNDTVTGGEHDVLSAEQGKVLNDEINRLKGDVYEEVAIYDSAETIKNAGVYISPTNNAWKMDETTPQAIHSLFYPVSVGDSFYFRSKVDKIANIAFLQDTEVTVGSEPNYCVGYDSVITFEYGQELSITSDVSGYLYIAVRRTGSNIVYPEIAVTYKQKEVDAVFGTGEEVEQVSIVNDTVTGGEHDVLSAEQGKV